MKKMSIATFAATLLGSVFATLSYGQGTYQQGYDNNNDLVVIYEDCDFRGKAVRLNAGEYRSIRRTGFGNDKMSSIKVPRGIEVVIFEDDDFRGPYARVDRDIRCFDRRWNDKVSSIQISEPDYRGHDNSRSYRNPNRNSNPNYEGRDYDNYGEGGQVRSSDRRGYDSRRDESHVTAKNISQVVFGGIILQQLNKEQWRMNSPRGGVSQYKEVRRDRDSVYLQNDYTAEQVRIDLFANDVTFIKRNGRQQRYAINRKQAALSSAPARVDEPRNESPNAVIRGACFNYKAYTTGGSGGVRFHGKDGFFQFNKKAHSGKICHQGKLTMEINKTEPATEVIVEIQNRKYRFSAFEKEDVLLNTWYRKKIDIKVRR